MLELSILLLVFIIVMALVELRAKHMAAIESMLEVVNTILIEANPNDIEEITKIMKTSNLDSLPFNLFSRLDYLRSVKITLTAEQRKKVTNEFAKLACDYLKISPEFFELFMTGGAGRFPKNMKRSTAIKAEMYVTAFNQVLLSLSHEVSWVKTFGYLLKVRQTCLTLEKQYGKD